MACNICVVGTIIQDLVVRAPRFAKAAETIIGEGFESHPGGKGANQAVAVSRMGGQVSLVGCIGDDEWGSEMRAVLTANGVDIHHVRSAEGVHTGVSMITVVPGGEHAAVVAPGANACLSPEDVEEASRAIVEADVLVLQTELAVETNLRAIEIAKQGETSVLLKASPASGATPELLAQVDLLVVSRDRAAELLGDSEQEISPAGLARRLATMGPERVVVTLGAEGALHFNGRDVKTFDSFPAETTDTTACGDAFIGALAVLRSEGARLPEAVRFASAAGALATTCAGAIPSLPTREQVEEFLAGAD